MPIYEYICQSCGKHAEFWQGISENPKKECPHCHKKSLKRIISLSAFHLKGSGWYATDYAGKNGSTSKPAASGDKGGKPVEETRPVEPKASSSVASTAADTD